MNINTSGIVNKLKKHADILAFFASAYERFDGLDGAVNHYTKGAVFRELGRTVSNLNLVKHKLWESDHAYTGMFKMSVYAWLAAEFGIIDKKWQNTAKKVMTGAGIAALTLPGHGTPSDNKSSGGSSRGWGQ